MTDEELDLDREQTTIEVLNEVLDERKRQFDRFGEQNHPDGTSSINEDSASMAKLACERADSGGYLTWYHISNEEHWEAMAETDQDALRKELIQDIAVKVAWVECIDRRKVDK